MKLFFKVPGKVKAKQGFKIGRRGQYACAIPWKDCVDYANWVKQCFTTAYPQHLPSVFNDKPIKMQINVFFEIPKSYSKKKKTDCLSHKIRPTIKPDYDNIAKNIGDALNGIAYPDDKQIVSGTVNKFYSDTSYVEIEITDTD